jgi:hypothetical protein
MKAAQPPPEHYIVPARQLSGTRDDVLAQMIDELILGASGHTRAINNGRLCRRRTVRAAGDEGSVGRPHARRVPAPLVERAIISPLQETTLTAEYRVAERPDTCGSRPPIPAALSWLRNPGSHGFSEMRYEFSSAAAITDPVSRGWRSRLLAINADRHTAGHDRPCVEMEHRSAFCG